MRCFLNIFLLISFPLLGVDSYTLKVEGSGEVSVKATLADVRLGIEVEGKNSATVQGELSEKLNRLVAKLEEKKVQKVQTTSLTVFPLYTEQQPTSIRGFRGNAEVLMTTPIEQAGAFIGNAMEFGATKINGIELKAEDVELAEAHKKAVQKACENGMGLANAALHTLGLEKKEIVNINLTPEPDRPIPFPKAMAFEASNRGYSGPDLQGEQTIRSQVTLTLVFKDRSD